MTAPKPTNIIIFGATGAIGRYITEAIIDAKSKFGKLAVFTSPGTAEVKRTEIQALKDQDVEIIIGDIDNENDIANSYKSFDTVVSCLGRSVISKQIPLLRLAEASNTINYFFPSEYGTDIEYSPSSSPSEPPHQQKLAVRDYIEKNIRKLSYTYVVTGPYSDYYISPPNARQPKLGGFDPVNRKAVLLGRDGNGKVGMTTMADTGKFVVAALCNPEAARNRALKVSSFTATPKEVLSEFERQTKGNGGEWEVEFTDLDELRALEKEAYKADDPMKTGYTLKRIWTEGGTLYDGDGGKDGKLLGGVRTETLEEQVAKKIAMA